MDKIKFGTDGWRAIIASDFTFANVFRVGQAIADYLGANKRAAVGFDTRFMSSVYAGLIAEVMSGNGIRAILSKYPIPTPMLSYKVKADNLDGGVMITASHNPGIYNGIKFKESFGGSALSSTTRELESLLDLTEPKKSGDLIEDEDMSSPYLDALMRYVDEKSLKRKKYKIVVDSMYGAGGYYLEGILERYGHKVVTIHGSPNPLFPGLNPEPIESNLGELSRKVREYGADIGIATDGDADRVGIVDGNGKFLTPHQALSLLFIHLKTSRDWHGIAVKTISTTSLINKIADKYNTAVKETPVGFKYIVDWMLKEDVLIGGEESGGNGFMKHIPERDAFLSGLLLVEMMGARRKSVKQLVDDMEKEFGGYKYKRIDAYLEQDKIRKLYSCCEGSPPEKIAGVKIKEIKSFDGIKLILEDDSWLLLRGAGTEPLLRMYAEAKTVNKVNRLLDAGRKLIRKL